MTDTAAVRQTPRIYRAVTTTPWAIAPAKLAEIGEFIAMRSRGVPLERAEVEFALDGRPRPRDDADPPYRLIDRVALISLYGVILPRANLLLQFSGGTSTQLFSQAVEQAVADEEVETIVLDVDSPGGSVVGVQEAADTVRWATARKKVVAVATSQMASAAYWIGAAAGEVVASLSSQVGSIGVYSLHLDQSRRDKKEGLRVTVIQRGQFKTDGIPHKRLTEQGRNTLQEQVDAYYSMFVHSLAVDRRVSVATVETDFGQGKTFLAQQATLAGMVDRVGTLGEIVGELRRPQAARSPLATSGRYRTLANRIRLLEMARAEGDLSTEAELDVTKRELAALESGAPN
ncbi:MAG TPA: S49 family peptidase [Thermoguttaceae bacterium]|nr:S49 family peptidase [Thermoguttaceae bacterium]